MPAEDARAQTGPKRFYRAARDWQPVDVEEAHGLLITEYSRMAAAYDRDYAPYNAPMVGRILELAALSGGRRVLELGCGTGILAFEAARRIGATGSVVGIDSAKGMINVATVKGSRTGARNVRFALMDTGKSPSSMARSMLYSPVLGSRAWAMSGPSERPIAC